MLRLNSWARGAASRSMVKNWLMGRVVSRQPEAIGKLQTAMLIALAFVELVFLLTVFVGMSALPK